MTFFITYLCIRKSFAFFFTCRHKIQQLLAVLLLGMMNEYVLTLFIYDYMNILHITCIGIIGML
jgi:hypothetical protein